jgi:hypothetical protein
MTNDEYREMIEFLGRKFDEVDTRFDAIDRRFDVTDAKITDTRRHFDVVAEAMRDQVRLVAEGVSNVEQGLQRFKEEVGAEFAEVKSMIRFSYAELDRRIQLLERSYVSLEERVGRLESGQR